MDGDGVTHCGDTRGGDASRSRGDNTTGGDGAGGRGVGGLPRGARGGVAGIWPTTGVGEPGGCAAGGEVGGVSPEFACDCDTRVGCRRKSSSSSSIRVC